MCDFVRDHTRGMEGGPPTSRGKNATTIGKTRTRKILEKRKFFVSNEKWTKNRVWPQYSERKK
jgi:hypothetical protein